MIYALCDKVFLDKNNYSLDDFINATLSASKKYNSNICMVQYRDKTDISKSKANTKKSLAYLNEKFNSNSKAHIPIIINDYLDLLEYCDGIHLGQEDLASINKDIKLASKMVYLKTIKKSKLFGLSTHNEIEILKANTLKLSYIGLGAYRQSNTKDVSNILSHKIEYLAKISKHPVAVIGGVKLSDSIKNATYKCVCSSLFE